MLKFIKQVRLVIIPRTLLRWGRATISLTILFTFNSCDREELITAEPLTVDNKAQSNGSAGVSLAGTEFTVVVMPDTQHYMAGFFGGTVAMFNSQISWIRANKTAQNIVYVVGVGDVVEHGDNPTHVGEWTNAATNGYYKLETDNIPYGLAVGNHDQGLDPYTDWGNPLTSPTAKYNQYFGRTHFNNASHSYWKGSYKTTDNDSHYDFFTAGGLNFMVIYIEYDQYNADRGNMAAWAKQLCLANPTRKVIVVSHYIVQNGTQGFDGGGFGAQGQGLYDSLKVVPNVFMFLSGHISGATSVLGEGYREDNFNGRTIRSYMSDYQGRVNGGDGLLRLMKFSVDGDDVSVKTYSTSTSSYETDYSSQFTKPLFGPAPTASIANGKYKIIAKHSGQALVVKDASTANGARIVQWTYADNGVNNDQWTLTQIGTSGYYRFINVLSGKDMAISGGSTEYGAGDIGIAIQWPYNAAYPWNDEWALIPVSAGYYKVIARHSGLCLNVAGGNNTLGAQVKQWKYLATDAIDNDLFQFVSVP
ncbi:RICIN domain-containing protein [Pedobacter heparinus]|uniref:RICIN domain-containing protein n=1 Tax=Pedobacter heparinus TaxID=984 RepID=UPI00292F48EE|nr:RICIN domain-containing protein [Pedobacter heparinus]